MTHIINNPPEQPQRTPIQFLRSRAGEPTFSRLSILSLLLVSSLLLLLFTGFAIRNLPRDIQASTQQQMQSNQNIVSIPDGPLSRLAPANTTIPPLQLPGNGQHVLYEQDNKIFNVSPHATYNPPLKTPGYIYNRAVPPILLQSGQLLYSGNGLWLLNISGGAAQQIARLPAGQVITSMKLSHDETSIAWSSEPMNGKGMVNVYAGSLRNTQPIYQHSANQCPCFRVFSFFDASGKGPNSMLLLTDDRGDHRAVQFGLWTLDLTALPAQHPQLLLHEERQQGPLDLIAANNTLLYSSDEEIVPAPIDKDVPDEVVSLNYPNSLSLTRIDGKSLQLRHSTTLLPEQGEQSNIAESRWAATPVISPDGQTLAYDLFSSDAQDPFERHNALYTVHIHESGTQLHADKAQLLASATVHFLELGPWLNNSVLTFYADGKLYAVDVNSGAVATLASMGAYARIFAVISQ